MVGQNVYVKATTPIHDYNVKMRLSNCYTKPSKSASDVYIYYLIRNGCPAEPNAFITTKTTHETRFHFQDFEYAFHPDSMYVHCNATFCHSNDYSSDCEPRCSNRKRVGSIDQDDEPIEGVGPIGYAEDEATLLFRKGPEALNAGNKQEEENKGNKPLYVVGVVVVAVAMVAILVGMSIYFRSKRRQNGQSKIV
ncbi:pancreatic secretory granule membrane major glycoprotein GP2-like [Mytilus californianus]|uniref:pancreatic secretory granule membrane major glycoprotein GP2-like n=1 Tax=Mytilus californianus TaxID=6549 RepID=UPI0022479A7A|nr:pancreatic secretory granule membrane major glycoprotein GP2-like [Mytilus californianus]